MLELRNLVQQEMETNPVLEELATDPEAPPSDSAANDQESLPGRSYAEVDSWTAKISLSQAGIETATDEPSLEPASYEP